MDSADVISLVSGIAAMLGAGVAIWQAFEARHARDEARQSSEDAAVVAAESVAAWKSMAESQKVVALAHRPKAWSEAKRGGRDIWTVRNTSERQIYVVRIDVTPEDAASRLRVEGLLPRRFKPGELLEFYTESRMNSGVRIVTIVWRFDDEDGPLHESPRRVS